ncbi:MAG: prepilin peptidase [Verrucomicrobiota bacterium]|jgi:leader peptidase (prepilin peptidase)/N-methyltransferase
MSLDNVFNPHNWAVVPFHFWSLVFFALGCIVGSFLNVCIYRLPRDLSIVSPPSHCPHCKYSIPFYLNVPLLTWLMLRGRCKNCGAPISPRYFVVEWLTGVTFLGCWLAFGQQRPAGPWLALVYCLFLAGLIVATFIDFEHLIIPDEITLGGAAAGLVISFFLPALHHVSSNSRAMLQSALGMAAGAGLIYAVVRGGKLLFGRQKVKLPPGAKIVFSETSLALPDLVIPYEDLFYRPNDTIVFRARRLELVDRSYANATVRLSPARLRIGDEEIDPERVPHMEAVCSEIILPREAMGLGDVKFMAAIGAFLGWQAVLFTFFVACMVGAVYGSGMVLLKKQKWSGRLYFGPFLALAATVWVFGGLQLITLYLRFSERLLTRMMGQY